MFQIDIPAWLFLAPSGCLAGPVEAAIYNQIMQTQKYSWMVVRGICHGSGYNDKDTFATAAQEGRTALSR